jgi:hypothetical protein
LRDDDDDDDDDVDDDNNNDSDINWHLGYFQMVYVQTPSTVYN